MNRLLMLFSSILMTTLCGNGKAVRLPSDESHAQPYTDNGFLRADGKNIVDGNGNTVLLMGTNLGGWLLREQWMCAVTGNETAGGTRTHMDTLTELADRFGYENALALMDTYQSNWITEYDFGQMAALGMNCVRVPFGWWNFFKPDGDGNCSDEWIDSDFSNNPGFCVLDRVIEMGKKYGLYIIPDMHGCPGGQTADHTSGSYCRCELFDKPQYADMMERLWTAIAERYKNETVVAGYDIMNEPRELPNVTSENDPRNAMYDRMIGAIRKVDGNHIIFVEGIWNIGYLPPDPETRGWTNVVYSLHCYGAKAADYCAHLERTINEKSIRVPIYIGEFFDTDYMKLCVRNGRSFSSRCYKGAASDNEIEPHSIFCYKYYRDSADVSNDSESRIRKKWEKTLRTDSGHFKTTVAYDARTELKKVSDFS